MHSGTRKKQVRIFKSKLPVQEAQEARGGAATWSTLAELEEKRVFEKNRIEAKIQQAIDRRVEVVAGGIKEKKALDEMIADKKLQIDENVRMISSKAEEECKELRDQLEALEKEVKVRKDKLQAQAGLLLNTSATSTTPPPPGEECL